MEIQLVSTEKTVLDDKLNAMELQSRNIRVRKESLKKALQDITISQPEIKHKRGINILYNLSLKYTDIALKVLIGIPKCCACETKELLHSLFS